MSNDNPQEEQLNFRQDVVDTVFSQSSKPFYVQSPSKLTVYTFIFVALLLLALGFLFITKLPNHINAIGEVLAGKEYYQVVINDDKKMVAEAYIHEGESVKQGDVLLRITNRDSVSTQRDILDLNIQIEELNKRLSKSTAYYQQRVGNITQQRKEQETLIAQLSEKLKTEQAVLARYIQSVANGLVSATLKDTQTRVVAEIESSLLKEKTVFTSLDLHLLEIEDEYKREQHAALVSSERLLLEREQLTSGMNIQSPCDCVVDNMLIEAGQNIVPGQSILTLSQSRDTSSLVLYVPAKQYRDIPEGDKIQVKLASYPASKYGVLTATITNVSASPVPGNMISKKGQGLDDSSYFIVKAIIESVPNEVTLVTGMAINSDIVVDHISLFDLLFDFTKHN